MKYISVKQNKIVGFAETASQILPNNTEDVSYVELEQGEYDVYALLNSGVYVNSAIYYVAPPTVRPEVYDLDLQSLTWVCNLSRAKTVKWNKIKEERTSAFNVPLVTSYGTFDAYPAARTSITDSILMLQTLAKRGLATTVNFTLADNTDVDLDLSQMEDVGLMLGERTNTIYNKGRLLRAAIDAAVSLEEVEAVVW